MISIWLNLFSLREYFGKKNKYFKKCLSLNIFKKIEQIRNIQENMLKMKQNKYEGAKMTFKNNEKQNGIWNSKNFQQVYLNLPKT